jgi:alpha-ribazole phosphatase
MVIDLGSLPDGCTFRLVLLRHGEPSPEAQGRCYGRLEFELSEAGRRQIEEKCKRLTNLRAHALYSSPRKRALESAAIAGEILGLKPQMVEELSELDFGAFEGMPYQEIERLYPEEYRMWMEQPTKMTFPGGESFADLARRVLKFMSALPDRHAKQTVLIVAHAGVNRIILANALGLPSEMIFRIDQEYAGVSGIDYFSQHPVVRFINA